jgi:hypothetical protein
MSHTEPKQEEMAMPVETTSKAMKRTRRSKKQQHARECDHGRDKGNSELRPEDVCETCAKLGLTNATSAKKTQRAKNNARHKKLKAEKAAAAAGVSVDALPVPPPVSEASKAKEAHARKCAHYKNNRNLWDHVCAMTLAAVDPEDVCDVCEELGLTSVVENRIKATERKRAAVKRAKRANDKIRYKKMRAKRAAAAAAAVADAGVSMDALSISPAPNTNAEIEPPVVVSEMEDTSDLSAADEKMRQIIIFLDDVNKSMGHSTSPEGLQELREYLKAGDAKQQKESGRKSLSNTYLVTDKMKEIQSNFPDVAFPLIDQIMAKMRIFKSARVRLLQN